MREFTRQILRIARGSLLGAVLLPALAANCYAGRLVASTFEDVVIVWKSEQDLEAAVSLIVAGQVKDGDFDALLECWVNSGQGAEILENLSDGLILKVRVDDGDCEGIVFAEEYSD